jgi:ABC-type polysaccharide/polyol phosphate transport system ATPase subunit
VIEQGQPDILLLDEVHEAIDGDFRDHVEEVAETLRRRGGIVIAAAMTTTNCSGCAAARCTWTPAGSIRWKAGEDANGPRSSSTHP